jgi:hypothetical protein
MRVNGKQKEEKRICKLWKALPVEAKLNLANRSEIYNINDLVDTLECIKKIFREIGILQSITKENYINDELQKEIDRSQEILKLKDNWDDEGSPAIKKETLKKAIEFIKKQAEIFWDKKMKHIDVPEILPGPNGSIDILWDKEKYELLLNFPADKERVISYYGYRKKKKKIGKKNTI